MRILAFFNLVSIEFHKVSVTCGIPDRDNPAENIFLGKSLKDNNQGGRKLIFYGGATVNSEK